MGLADRENTQEEESGFKRERQEHEEERKGDASQAVARQTDIE